MLFSVYAPCLCTLTASSEEKSTQRGLQMKGGVGK